LIETILADFAMNEPESFAKLAQKAKGGFKLVFCIVAISLSDSNY